MGIRSKNLQALAHLVFKSPSSPRGKELLQTIKPVLLEYLPKFTRIDISYILSSYARKCPDPEVLKAFSNQASAYMHLMKEKDLAGILGSLSAMSEDYSQLYLRAAGRVLELEFPPKELSLILNAYSKIPDSGHILQALEPKVIGKKHEFDSIQLGLVIASYGKRLPHSKVFKELEEVLLSKNLDNTAKVSVLYWYARSSYANSAVVENLSNMLDFEAMNNQELVNTYVALVLTKSHTENSLTVIESKIKENLDELTPQGIANLLDSQCRLNRATLVSFLAEKISKSSYLQENCANPLVHLVMTIHSLSKLQTHTFLIPKLLQNHKSKKIPATELAIITYSFCIADLDLPTEITQQLPQALPELEKKHIINLAVNLSKPKYFSSEFWKLFERYFLEAVSTESGVRDSNKIRNSMLNLEKVGYQIQAIK